MTKYLYFSSFCNIIFIYEQYKYKTDLIVEFFLAWDKYIDCNCKKDLQWLFQVIPHLHVGHPQLLLFLQTDAVLLTEIENPDIGISWLISQTGAKKLTKTGMTWP